jgi:hypothetical protein
MRPSSHDLAAELEDARELLAWAHTNPNVSRWSENLLRDYILLLELYLRFALARECESVKAASVEHRIDVSGVETIKSQKR